MAVADRALLVLMEPSKGEAIGSANTQVTFEVEHGWFNEAGELAQLLGFEPSARRFVRPPRTSRAALFERAACFDLLLAEAASDMPHLPCTTPQAPFNAARLVHDQPEAVCHAVEAWARRADIEHDIGSDGGVWFIRISFLQLVIELVAPDWQP